MNPMLTVGPSPPPILALSVCLCLPSCLQKQDRFVLINDLYYTREGHGKPWAFKKSQFRKLEVPPQVRISLTDGYMCVYVHVYEHVYVPGSSNQKSATQTAPFRSAPPLSPPPHTHMQAVVELLQGEHGMAGAALHTLEFGLVAVIGTKPGTRS
jgi:hypothetical protein